MLKRIATYLQLVLYIALLVAVTISFIPGISSNLQRAVLVVFGAGILVLEIVLPIKAISSARKDKRSLLLCSINLVLGIVFVAMIVLTLFTMIQIHWAFIALVAGLLFGLSFLKDNDWRIK